MARNGGGSTCDADEKARVITLGTMEMGRGEVSQGRSRGVDTSGLPTFFRTLDRMSVIDTHKVRIMYVAPGQTHEREILCNNHGSPAYPLP